MEILEIMDRLFFFVQFLLVNSGSIFIFVFVKLFHHVFDFKIDGELISHV